MFLHNETCDLLYCLGSGEDLLPVMEFPWNVYLPTPSVSEKLTLSKLHVASLLYIIQLINFN